MAEVDEAARDHNHAQQECREGRVGSLTPGPAGPPESLTPGPAGPPESQSSLASATTAGIAAMTALCSGWHRRVRPQPDP